MKKQKGFSLIELLIVVAIILIIAAIAVPNLLRSRMAANEASAAGSERTIATSNVTYSTTYGIGFAQALVSLGPGGGGGAASNQADLIDATLAGGVKSGYSFNGGPGAYQANDANGDGIFDSYTEYAAPTQNNVTGVTVFCVDQTNVVFRDPGGTGSSAGPTTAGQVCSGGNWVPL